MKEARVRYVLRDHGLLGGCLGHLADWDVSCRCGESAYAVAVHATSGQWAIDRA